jgi:hypothetical protein
MLMTAGTVSWWVALYWFIAFEIMNIMFPHSHPPQLSMQRQFV